MKRDKVFVCYSHKDRRWLDELSVLLAPFEREGRVVPWDDTKLNPGGRWDAEIRQALLEACTAILLVTPEFLESSYIQEVELPAICEAADKSDLLLLAVLVSGALYKKSPLAGREFANPVSKPLDIMTKPLRRRTLVEILQRLESDLKQHFPDLAPPGNTQLGPRIDVSRLPVTDYALFGRSRELKLLTTAWQTARVRLFSIIAQGGTGKTALINRWIRDLGKDDSWGGAQRVFVWSFYTQGSAADRQVSSEPFMLEAFKFFGIRDPGPISAAAKGTILAEALRRQRALLVLDGLEPLQEPPGAGGHPGRLRDQGVRSLLLGLATGQPGLCILTSRLSVADLGMIPGDNQRQCYLEQLKPTAGAQLLRHLLAPGDASMARKERVARLKDELHRAAAEFGGHPLALRLLANYTATALNGDIRRRGQIGPLLHEEGGHARRVMREYESWFADKVELEILYLLGLFDRPAASEVIAMLRKAQPLVGLTEKTHHSDEAQWNIALEHLEKAGLISVDAHGGLDTHPIIRAYFGERLQELNPHSWRAAHTLLYTHFRQSPAKASPETIAEIEPLFRAVFHGCAAGLHQAVFDEVYWPRIERGDEHFAEYRLGLWGSVRSALTCFFVDAPHCLHQGLNLSSQALILRQYGYCSRGLGEIHVAQVCSERALTMSEAAMDWYNASVSALLASMLHLLSGNCQAALLFAKKALRLARRSGNWFRRVVSMTVVADVLHQMGYRKKSLRCFAAAERFQREHEPNRPLLYTGNGTRYCELLCGLGEYEAVRQRILGTHDLKTQQSGDFTEGLSELVAGWLELGLAAKGESAQAAKGIRNLERAETLLKAAGREDLLPRVLLARAGLHRTTSGFCEAYRDLDNMLEIVNRDGIKLHLADFHLERARLFRAVALTREEESLTAFLQLVGAGSVAGKKRSEGEGSRAAPFEARARHHLGMAARLTEEMAYGRRFDEVEELKKQLGIT